MDWVSWDHTLETGYPALDAEHKELARLFNLLARAAEKREGRDACARLLENIVERALRHFELEGELMSRHRYPKTEQHEAEHEMLIEQALHYKASFDRELRGSRVALTRFPEVWLAFHILFSDKELADFLARAA